MYGYSYAPVVGFLLLVVLLFTPTWFSVPVGLILAGVLFAEITK